MNYSELIYPRPLQLNFAVYKSSISLHQREEGKMFSRGERNQLKLQDKLIEEERERERNYETQTTQEISPTHPLQHISHPHPLFYVEANYRTFSCNSCTKRGRGKRYHCSQCNFDLHKICAQTPLTWLLHHMPPQELEAYWIRPEAITTFAHPNHEVATHYKKEPFKCLHCKGSGNGLRFSCEPCDAGIHPVCAKNPTRLTSYLHPEHELELCLRPHFKKCDLCGTTGPSNNRVYTCKSCDFYLHPRCSQWPLYLIHPVHPPHPLMLKPFRDPGDEYMYSCKLCDVGFNLDYLLTQSRFGKGDQVRQRYTGYYIDILSATNLFAPEPSLSGTQIPQQFSLGILPVIIAGIAIGN